MQEILKKLRLDAPDFVHVDRNVMSVKIKGLKPSATYEMKVQTTYNIIKLIHNRCHLHLAMMQVVAYSDERHEASKPVIVDTKDLGRYEDSGG